MKSPQKKGTPWWLIGGLVLALGGGGFVFYSNVVVPRREAKAKALTVPVERLAMVPLTVSANGVIQPERSVNVSPKTPGLLKQLLVKEGDRVQQGQMLAKMDDSNLLGQITQAKGQLAASRANLQRLQAGNRPQDIAQSQARMRDAQFALQLAENTLQRNEALYKDGAISALALDNARTERDRTQAQLNQTQEAMALAQAGARREDIAQAQAQVVSAQGVLQSAQIQLNDTVIRAPFGGTVTRKFADPGAFVTPTTAGSAVSSATSSSILSLAGVNQVVASVAEANVAQLQLGQTATIKADAYQGKSFTGKVIEISPQSVVVQNVTSFEVKVAILSDSQGILRSGMNVDVEFKVGALRNAVMVPTVAIVRQASQSGVYIEGADKKPVFTSLTTGITVDTRTQVLSGLKGGEQVFISFPEGFRPETKIPGLGR
jgi:HlyD family secretion protein